MWYFNSNNAKRVLVFSTALFLTVGLTACGKSGKKHHSNPTTPPVVTPPIVTDPPFEATAFAGNIKIFPTDVVTSILSMDHAITATYVLDDEGVEKLVFYFEDTEGETTPGADLAGIDSTEYFLSVYIPETSTVCVKYPDYFEHTSRVNGDLTSDAITFKYCADDVIQAETLADDWIPVASEYFTAESVFETLTDDGNVQTFNVSASVDYKDDVVLYTSIPEVTNFEAIYSPTLNTVCINFISTYELWSFEARVNGVSTMNSTTDGLETYLGDDLVINKTLFLIGCTYDIEDWKVENNQ